MVIIGVDSAAKVVRGKRRSGGRVAGMEMDCARPVDCVTGWGDRGNHRVVRGSYVRLLAVRL
jgi:hypothetical protein